MGIWTEWILSFFAQYIFELEHIIGLYYRTTWWMFTNLGRDKVLKAPHMCLGFSANSTKGWFQGGAKVGQWGVTLLQRSSPSDWKAIATNQMHSSDLKACRKKRCYFLVPFGSQFFNVLLTLVWWVGVIWVSLCNLLCGKMLYLHILGVISMLIIGRMLI